MVKYLIILLVTFLLFTLFVISTSAYGQTSDYLMQWSKTVNIPDDMHWGYYGTSSIIKTVDGSFAVLSHADAYTALSYSAVSHLTKINQNGDVLWIKAYDEPGYSCSLYSIYQTADGGYIMCGENLRAYDPETPWRTVYPIVIKTDASGNIQWKENFTDDLFTYSSAIIQTKDNGYLVVSSDFIRTDAYPVTIRKLDNDGNILWNRSYYGKDIPFGTYSGRNPDSGFTRSIIKTTDGEYVIKMMLRQEGLSPELRGWDARQYIGLVKVNDNGDIVWARSYGNSDSYTDDSSLTLTQDNGYMLSSSESLGTARYVNQFSSIDIGNYYFNIENYFLKIDANGDRVWSRAIANFSGPTVFCTDDGYLVAGDRYEVANDTVENHHEMIKLDLEGNLLWRKPFDWPGPLQGNILSYSNGSYLLGGDAPDLRSVIIASFRDVNRGEIVFNNSSINVQVDQGTISLPIVRAGGSDGTINVNFTTVDGTAIAGQDYVPINGTITFADSETSKNVTITLLNRGLSNVSLSFNIVLNNVTGGATLGEPNTETIMIGYPDNVPVFSLEGIIQLFGGNQGGSDNGNKGLTVPSISKIIGIIIPLLIGFFLGFFWPWLAKLLQFLYDAVKSYLQKQFSTREAKYRGVTARSRQPWLLGISLTELFAGIAGILLIGITFAYAKDYLFSGDKLVVILVAAGITIVISEMARRYTARHYKADTEYKFWGLGAVTLIITSLLHQPFSRPARTIVNRPGELDARKQGIIAMAPCLISLVLSIVFLMMLAYGNGYEMLGREGFKMGMMLCVYSLLPFDPMDGKRVIGWNKAVWAIVFLPALVFYLGMLLFVFP